MKQRGFTIVELLIVIVVIAILASIVIVAYDGFQQRAQDARRQSDISSIRKILETYNVEHGEYPTTTNQSQANWKSIDVYTDDNCYSGSSQADWIPGVNTALPQGIPNTNQGADSKTGCYLYASNGSEYVLSAWNMLNAPQTVTMYRRLGFREFQTATSAQFYTCNTAIVGGVSGGSYNVEKDYYKYSYTISNITNCDETPPPGA